MKAFYEKTGNHKLRFKPAYNPYTEPSMEVFSWHEGLQKWIEIANVSHRRSDWSEIQLTPVWGVQARDVGTYGSAQGRESARVGYVARTTNDDQVSTTRATSLGTASMRTVAAIREIGRL